LTYLKVSPLIAQTTLKRSGGLSLVLICTKTMAGLVTSHTKLAGTSRALINISCWVRLLSWVF